MTNRISTLAHIAGLCLRSIHLNEDAEALYAVHTGRITHDQVDPRLYHEDLPSLEGLRSDLQQAIESQEFDQWLVAQVDDRVVGYSQLMSWHEDDGVWVYLICGWVLPEWRGQGIGTAMLRCGESTARESTALEHPHERFEFAANASCTERDATLLLLNEGYHVAFTTLEMKFDISTTLPASAPLLPGVEVRPVLPEHRPLIIASIIESYVDAFPGNRFRTTFDRAAYYAGEFQKPKYDPSLWYVAWDGDEVAGQVMMVLENGQAYVNQVSVRPAWRRRGLARTLLIRALQDVRQRGVEVIWTDTYAEYQTRAVDLYRSLGFYVAKEFPRYRKSP
jgi:mycothiol synthase